MRSRSIAVFVLLFFIALQARGDNFKIAGQEITIGPNAIGIPAGHILLIRKNETYCGVRFQGIKKGEKKDEWYVQYEASYQGDGTGNLSSLTTKHIKKELSQMEPERIIGRLALSRGNTNIDCVGIQLDWSGSEKLSWVYFYNSSEKPGDYGIEFAPTKWTAINQANVFDKKLKWYRYDEKRKDITIPIDKLW